MCSQVEFWSKGLIRNNGGTNSFGLDRNPVGVAVYNIQNDRVFEHQYVIQVGGQCQLDVIFGGNGAFTGFHCPKGLFVSLQHKTHGNREAIPGFPSRRRQSCLHLKRPALWNSTSETNIIIFFSQITAAGYLLASLSAKSNLILKSKPTIPPLSARRGSLTSLSLDDSPALYRAGTNYLF